MRNQVKILLALLTTLLLCACSGPTMEEAITTANKCKAAGYEVRAIYNLWDGHVAIVECMFDSKVKK
jgi:outer membrane biogenesis lipoprotein LolB